MGIDITKVYIYYTRVPLSHVRVAIRDIYLNTISKNSRRLSWSTSSAGEATSSWLHAQNSTTDLRQNGIMLHAWESKMQSSVTPRKCERAPSTSQPQATGTNEHNMFVRKRNSVQSRLVTKSASSLVSYSLELMKMHCPNHCGRRWLIFNPWNPILVFRRRWHSAVIHRRKHRIHFFHHINPCRNYGWTSWAFVLMPQHCWPQFIYAVLIWPKPLLPICTLYIRRLPSKDFRKHLFRCKRDENCCGIDLLNTCYTIAWVS